MIWGDPLKELGKLLPKDRPEIVTAATASLAKCLHHVEFVDEAIARKYNEFKECIRQIEAMEDTRKRYEELSKRAKLLESFITSSIELQHPELADKQWRINEETSGIEVIDLKDLNILELGSALSGGSSGEPEIP